MDDVMKNKMDRAFMETAEKFSFFLSEETMQTSLEKKGNYLHLKMAITGQKQGKLVIFLPEQFCLELTDNLLGAAEYESLENEDVIDACKEFLNIICGNILTETFGTEPVFNLSIPEASLAEKEELDNVNSEEGYSFYLLDEYAVAVKLDGMNLTCAENRGG